MEKKCTISEEVADAWKWILAGSVTITILFSILYMLLGNTYLAGLSRLVAFAGFAGFVMAFLQTRGRTDKIELHFDDKNLIISYFKSSEKKQEELFDFTTIDEIKCQPAPPIWNIFPRNNSTRFLISFTDSSNTLSMFRHEGRDIYIKEAETNKVISFLTQHISHIAIK